MTMKRFAVSTGLGLLGAPTAAALDFMQRAAPVMEQARKYTYVWDIHYYLDRVTESYNKAQLSEICITTTAGRTCAPDPTWRPSRQSEENLSTLQALVAAEIARINTKIRPLVEQARALLPHAQVYAGIVPQLDLAISEVATALAKDWPNPSGAYDAAWWGSRLSDLQWGIAQIQQMQAEQAEALRREQERIRAELVAVVQEAAALLSQTQHLRFYTNDLGRAWSELQSAVGIDQHGPTGSFDADYYRQLMAVVRQAAPGAEAERQRRMQAVQAQVQTVQAYIGRLQPFDAALRSALARPEIQSAFGSMIESLLARLQQELARAAAHIQSLQAAI